jgi:hypothetical protein
MAPTLPLETSATIDNARGAGDPSDEDLDELLPPRIQEDAANQRHGENVREEEDECATQPQIVGGSETSIETKGSGGRALSASAPESVTLREQDGPQIDDTSTPVSPQRKLAATDVPQAPRKKRHVVAPDEDSDSTGDTRQLSPVREKVVITLPSAPRKKMSHRGGSLANPRLARALDLSPPCPSSSQLVTSATK